jgi:hypothetical protein
MVTRGKAAIEPNLAVEDLGIGTGGHVVDRQGQRLSTHTHTWSSKNREKWYSILLRRLIPTPPFCEDF